MNHQTEKPSDRIVSMDQFRGYTVAGMFVVNFVGGLAAMPAVLKHHDIYFSYADTIMPSFMFAAGFSYRLAAMRRIAKIGRGRDLPEVLRPQPGAGPGLAGDVRPGRLRGEAWAELLGSGTWKLIGGILKANLWETLAIIGVTQIFLMPVIGRSSRARVIFLVACLHRPRADLALVQLLLRLRQAELDGRSLGPHGQVRLGRRLLRDHRLGRADALRHAGLRRDDQPLARPARRRVSSGWGPC